jgi:cation/acetate symporter
MATAADWMSAASFISIMLTNNPIPEVGLGGEYTVDGVGQGVSLLDKLDGLSQELGFAQYTSGQKFSTDVFFITAALACGTAGLPHVIVRFYTVKKASAARTSALWALLFIAILYTTAPAVAVFARTNLLQTIPGTHYADAPDWFKNWEQTDLICWVDKNGDGLIQYNGSGPAIVGKPAAMEEKGPDGKLIPGPSGEKRFSNERSTNDNELYIDRDIMVLANPEIARLPDWVVALVAAGGLAAALSTAAGLLLVISTSVAHDLVKRTLAPILGRDLSDRGELIWARCAAGVTVVIAGYFGVNPPGFVAQVVAFAFGLAASSFFPAIILGIFVKRTTMIGAISGMVIGILFTASYIIYFKFPDLMATVFGIESLPNAKENWWFGISPEGVGTLGMVLNFAVTVVVSLITPRPPEEVRELVERVRRRKCGSWWSGCATRGPRPARRKRRCWSTSGNAGDEATGSSVA